MWQTPPAPPSQWSLGSGCHSAPHTHRCGQTCAAPGGTRPPATRQQQQHTRLAYKEPCSRHVRRMGPHSCICRPSAHAATSRPHTMLTHTDPSVLPAVFRHASTSIRVVCHSTAQPAQHSAARQSKVAVSATLTGCSVAVDSEIAHQLWSCVSLQAAILLYTEPTLPAPLTPIRAVSTPGLKDPVMLCSSCSSPWPCVENKSAHSFGSAPFLMTVAEQPAATRVCSPC